MLSDSCAFLPLLLPLRLFPCQFPTGKEHVVHQGAHQRVLRAVLSRLLPHPCLWHSRLQRGVLRPQAAEGATRHAARHVNTLLLPMPALMTLMFILMLMLMTVGALADASADARVDVHADTSVDAHAGFHADAGAGLDTGVFSLNAGTRKIDAIRRETLGSICSALIASCAKTYLCQDRGPRMPWCISPCSSGVYPASFYPRDSVPPFFRSLESCELCRLPGSFLPRLHVH